ncbi:hypothetical protein GCM10022206_50360 [Streptomyces chiangmaiensis]
MLSLHRIINGRSTGPYPDVDDLDRALRKLLGEMRGLVSGAGAGAKTSSRDADAGPRA